MQITIKALNLEEYAKFETIKDEIDKKDIGSGSKFAQCVKAMMEMMYPKVDIQKISAGTAIAIFNKTWELTNKVEEDDLKNLKGSGSGTNRADHSTVKTAEK